MVVYYIQPLVPIIFVHHVNLILKFTLGKDLKKLLCQFGVIFLKIVSSSFVLLV